MKFHVWSSLLGSIALVHAQYIAVPVTKQSVESSGFSKRQVSNGSLQLTAQESGYTANISFGTPAQTVQLLLDTGSPLTWVNARNVSTFTPGSTPTSSQAAQGSAICAAYSCFQATTSSTLQVLANSTVFLIQYVGGTESVGRIVQDSAVFQGLADTTFEFGLVEYVYSPDGIAGAIGGILGLSPPSAVPNFADINTALQATAVTSSFVPTTILQQLQNAGAINSTAFSLYLSDDSEGQLVIGGVDSGRYTGPLTVVPIANTASAASTGGLSYYVNLNSVGTGGSTSSEITVGQPVVIDSGTTSTYIPATAAQSLAQALGGVLIPYDTSTGILAIPCSTSTTIDYYFDNSAVIRVPTSAIIDQTLSSAQAKRLGVTISGNLCVLSLFGTQDTESYLLGDSFLRSAYVVYDLEASSIALAQSAYDMPSNITAIGAGSFGIPGAVYNSSSKGAGNVAVVPSVTRTISAGTVVPETTSALGARGTATTTTGTTAASSAASSAARQVISSSGPAGCLSIIVAVIGLGLLFA